LETEGVVLNKGKEQGVEEEEEDALGDSISEIREMRVSLLCLRCWRSVRMRFCYSNVVCCCCCLFVVEKKVCYSFVCFFCIDRYGLVSTFFED
jgi:hypothetical protein